MQTNSIFSDITHRMFLSPESWYFVRLKIKDEQNFIVYGKIDDRYLI